jgi:HK97 gp10 family phage protein
MFSIRAKRQNEYILKSIKTGDRRTQTGLRKGWYFAGNDLRRYSQDNIKQGPKSGRIYQILVHGRRRRHQASAPGEFPANLTGGLQKSISFKVRGHSQLNFGSDETKQVRIRGERKKVNYGKFLEEGTSRMRPRPFLRPSIDYHKSNIIQHLEREIKKQLEPR